MLYNEHFCLNEVQQRWIENACCSDMRLNQQKTVVRLLVCQEQPLAHHWRFTLMYLTALTADSFYLAKLPYNREHSLDPIKTFITLL